MARRAVTGSTQSGYRYELAESAGRNFDPAFERELMPADMLQARSSAVST